MVVTHRGYSVNISSISVIINTVDVRVSNKCHKLSNGGLLTWSKYRMNCGPALAV